MDVSIWAFVGVVAGAIVGASASIITQVLFSASEDEAEAMMRSATSQADSFLENLGSVLRNQY